MYNDKLLLCTCIWCTWVIWLDGYVDILYTVLQHAAVMATIHEGLCMRRGAVRGYWPYRMWTLLCLVVGFAAQLLATGPTPRRGTKSDNAHPPIHPTKYTNGLQVRLVYSDFCVLASVCLVPSMLHALSLVFIRTTIEYVFI